MSEREDLERRLIELQLALKELGHERDSITNRLNLLRAAEPTPIFTFSDPGQLLGTPVSTAVPETPAQKIELFLKLFRCRESVFPKLWESKAGKKGYSPACNNEWVPGVCGKPPKGKVKCTECPNQAFPALDAIAVDRHLRGPSPCDRHLRYPGGRQLHVPGVRLRRRRLAVRCVHPPGCGLRDGDRRPGRAIALRQWGSRVDFFLGARAGPNGEGAGHRDSFKMR